MNYEDAQTLIKHHAYDGIAYTSRFGEYPNKQERAQLFRALSVIAEKLRGETQINRELASWLFTVVDQVQDNFHGAIERDIELQTDFDGSDVFQINKLVNAIFCDEDIGDLE